MVYRFFENAQDEPIPGFQARTVKGIRLAGASFPIAATIIVIIAQGNFPRLLYALQVSVIGIGGSAIFGYTFGSVFGTFGLLLMMAIARRLEMAEYRIWVAVCAGSLTGLMGTGVSLLLLFNTQLSLEMRLFVYLFVGGATLMGQIGAWLGARRAINAADNWQGYSSRIELPRFSLQVMFWGITVFTVCLGVMAAVGLPIIQILEIAVPWLVLQTCSMGIVLGLDRWMYRNCECST